MKEKADDNVITRQYLLKSEALMDYYCKRSDNQTTIEKLQEAVRLTLPDYEECLKKDFPFTEQEIMNLMSLANAYAHAGDVDEAVYIFERLLQCLQKDYNFGSYADYMKVLILRNLTVTYNKQKRYKEALTLCEQCLREALEKNIGNIISDVLSDKAWIILRQIETGERKKEDLQIGRELLQKAYYIAVARRSKEKCQILRNAYRKEFHMEL